VIAKHSMMSTPGPTSVAAPTCSCPRSSVTMASAKARSPRSRTLGNVSWVPDGRAIPMRRRRPVNGIAHWIGLDVDGRGGYEIRPGGGVDSCRAVMFHPLDRPLTIESGETVRVHARHDRQSLHLWASA
jgi:hypothetical protein